MPDRLDGWVRFDYLLFVAETNTLTLRNLADLDSVALANMRGIVASRSMVDGRTIARLARGGWLRALEAGLVITEQTLAITRMADAPRSRTSAFIARDFAPATDTGAVIGHQYR